MPGFISKQRIIAILILIVVVVMVIFLWKHNKSESTSQTKQAPGATQTPSLNEEPKIVSTKPESLDNTVVSATDNIEITFNRPLENVGEFKSKIEPKIDYKVQLSGDRKTAKIIQSKPYELGTEYTIFIGTETKFDGVGRWGQEKIIHFKTIKYTGV